MRIENPPPDETVNYPVEHPLREFIWLTAGILVVALSVFWSLGLLSGTLARQIPFRFEQKIAAAVGLGEIEDTPPRARLQDLADQLLTVIANPGRVEITVHYDTDEGVVNAFATLGGNLFIYKGLIDQLSSENALAMVVAHEIAHVTHRHPASALGRGLTAGMLLGALSGASAESVGNLLVGNVASLTGLKYSRDQEREADQSATNALIAHYGHARGGAELFRVFAELEESSATKIPGWLSTHPSPSDRAGRMQALADENEGRLTPLPDVLATRN